jgi:DNA-binding transcriptional LysR family regulator
MADDLDLNLLRVFDVLMDTGSVSAAAERLHLSIPATSRALGRLRRAMNDPIMVRAGRGLVPTPFALRSAARVKLLLEGAADLLTDTSDSPPQSWRRSFAIRVNDGLAPVLAPRLISQIARQATGITLRFIADDTDNPDALRNGSLDLDIGLAETPAPDVHVQQLYTDSFGVLVAANSRLGQADHLTMDQLCGYPHISTARGGADGPLDFALSQIGRSRRVIAVVPTYAVSALLALEKDVIAVVPGVLGRHLLDRDVKVRFHQLPLQLPTVTVDQRWHRRLDGDRPSQWLRSHVAAALQHLLVGQTSDPTPT